MSVPYTNEQQAAIDARGRDILVSAAAGSGKTAVLTERIMQYIATGEADIDQLLVVTFTEAAAAEMRERIADKIAQRQAAEPGNPYLARQAALLPGADISTIHAFCRKLLKQHFQQAGLDPSFKVGDETELSLIKAQVMDALFEEYYEQEDNNDFIDLADVFGGSTTDLRLDDLIRDLHIFFQNEPYPAQTAKTFADFYNVEHINLDGLPWTPIAREELSAGLEAALEGVKAARSLCLMPDGPAPYLTTLDADEDSIAHLLSVMDKPFVTLYAAFKSIAWERLPSIKATDGIDPELKDRAMDIRNKHVKSRIKDLTQGIFFAPPDKMLSDLQSLKNRVHTLIAVALRFSEKYAEEKRARNILDFNDLEQFAIRLLTEGEPLDFPYKEVLIDEYQDSNAVQELILSTVAGKNPRFMVGDVKQSIYRFRRANPRLFIDKMHPDSGTYRINLTQNFRSRPQVLDSVNFFFKKLMSPEVGEVDYDRQAMLHKGLDYPENGTLIESNFTTAIELAETAEEELSNLEQEVRVIARCILERVNKQVIWDAARQTYRPCRLDDIVILTRSVSGIASELTEALKQNGVDAVADLQTGFFETPEIKTALAFLRVIDNPRQDIELITVLHSPVYAFSTDELLEIREALPKRDFYDALTASSSEKARRFLTDLEKWRGLKTFMPISRLLGILYDDTHYPAYAGAMPGGAIRQANLRLLLERAIQYEETSLTGLFHFVRFIEELHTTGGAGSVSAAQSPGLMEDRVRIMTIHKAKGLEFPIVFVSRLGKKFNREDERQDVLLHPQYGLGLNFVDLKNRTKSNTLARYAISRLLRRESLSEELRVLYVAMTRAKEQLILTGCVKDYEEKKVTWETLANVNEELLPLYYRRECNTYLDWLLPCLAKQGGFSLRITKANEIGPLPLERMESICEESTPIEAFTFGKYPYPVNIPSKLSISEIKRLYASDITPDSTAIHISSSAFDMPTFLRTTQKIDARRLGTALHTIAEHMDVHIHREPTAIENLITDLFLRNLLTREEADAIDRDKIKTFMYSPLADRMRAAAKLYREIPFVMEVSEGYWQGEHNEKILVHGIIDCYFEESGGIVIVDYKSDAVYGDESQWANRHRVQLDIYKKAMEEATTLPIKEVLLYSFGLGRTVGVVI